MSDDAATMCWGRVRGDQNRGLRRGAWYRVVALGAREVVLDVNRKHVPLERAALHLISSRPQAWTVVRRPSDAKGVALAMGEQYAVCPSCRNRVGLKGNPPSARCARCAGVFRVAWAEWFDTLER